MVTTTDMLAYWDFDTDENPIQDQHGSYDLTPSGITFDTGDGKLGSSYLWDSSTDKATNGTLLDTVPSAFSISFWFKHEDTFDSGKSTAEYLISKDNVDGEDRFRIWLNQTDGKIHVGWEENNNGAQAIQSTTTSWTAGTWYHIVVTWDTTNGVKLWVNGANESSDGTATTLMGNGTHDDFIVGQSWGLGNGLNDGNIDEMGVWGRLLTDTEIGELYNGGDGLAYPFSGTNCQINIGDTWKTIDAMQINIGDTWKAVEGMQINIGDTWKEIF